MYLCTYECTYVCIYPSSRKCTYHFHILIIPCFPKYILREQAPANLFSFETLTSHFVSVNKFWFRTQ